LDKAQLELITLSASPSATSTQKETEEIIIENSADALPLLKLKNSNECLAANLQLIFTLMKESIRKSIDPNFFIKALGLDENMQQVILV
jgi:hypothetical protein